MRERNYDSTVARMAGNIASGFVSKSGGQLTDQTATAEWAQSVALWSVALARAIVAETIRTEPKAS